MSDQKIGFKIDDHDFYKNDTKEKLKKSIIERCNGYCILFDIINSTKRKKSNDNWHVQTEALYDTFFNLIGKIKKPIEDTVGNEFSQVIKLLGDGMFVFIETSKSGLKEEDTKPPIDISLKILSNVASYLKFIEDQSSNFNNLRLKTVITYVTGIRTVLNNEQKNDVLGRGIDFTFRLEKYADSGYIVVNNMFKDSVSDNMYNNDKNPNCIEEYKIVPCKKRIKGWDIEDFALLINRDDFISCYKHKVPAVSADHVYLELLKYLIDQDDKKRLVADDAFQWRGNDGQ
ncbi:MAG: hypothetical protein JXK07_07755 [Spirochaetes bacterium]|nr:hypothetical protein [Spirochaetota bacterium]MBN2770105.1 hypothetical protein [Spirochaetota bacterium]